MLVNVTPVPEYIKAEGKSQNFLEAAWKRLTSRSKRDERPATVGQGGGNRCLPIQEEFQKSRALALPYTQEKLIALVPFAKRKNTKVPYIEQTISAHPIFRFYVSDPDGIEGEFLLKDIDNNLVYKKVILLPAKPGIVNVHIPEKAYELKIGQQYSWIFSVTCNLADRSARNTVNGWIKRVSISEVLTINPATVSEQERLRLYADSLLWFDMIDTLLSLKRTYPQETEFKTTWEWLLRKMGLSDEAISRVANY